MLTPTLALPEYAENIYAKKRKMPFMKKNNFLKMKFLLFFKSW